MGGFGLLKKLATFLVVLLTLNLTLVGSVMASVFNQDLVRK